MLSALSSDLTRKASRNNSIFSSESSRESSDPERAGSVPPVGRHVDTPVTSGRGESGSYSLLSRSNSHYSTRSSNQFKNSMDSSDVCFPTIQLIFSSEYFPKSCQRTLLPQ